eukprot:m.307886 g.307886  ORF g.307886 m.307886 type:complete len:508 (+) comp42978_c0_seq1:104-1627(+)
MKAVQRGDEEPLMNQSRQSQTCPVALLVLILVCSLGLLAVTIILSMAKMTVHTDCSRYAVIIDGGSSGSRVIVYRWFQDEIEIGPGSQYGEACKTEPGLSSYADNPDKAGDSLVECLDKSKDIIPPSKHSITRLYLAATAGMRLLNDTDPDAANAIIEDTRKTLHQYPYQFEDDQSNIIKGDEEGRSGWTTLNYLLGNLQDKTSSGALDLGGASEQITFSLPPDADKRDTTPLHMFGENYTVYAHSYQCYGQDEAERRVLASLATSTNSSDVGNSSFVFVDNPCAYKDYVVNYTFGYVYKAPCTEAPDPSPYSSQTIFTFTGTANPTECEALIEKLFFSSECPPGSVCGINGQYQPPIPKGKVFYGMAAYYYNAEFLGLSGAETHLPEIEKAAKATGSKTWEQVQKENPNTPSQYLPVYCFSCQFMALNLRALSFTDTSPFVFTGEIKGTELEWTLGYFILQIIQLPKEKPQEVNRLTTGDEVALFCLICVQLALIIVALIAIKRGN